MQAVEIQDVGSIGDLGSHALAGEVLVVRHGLQQAGLPEDMLAATDAGLRAALRPFAFLAGMDAGELLPVADGSLAAEAIWR